MCSQIQEYHRNLMILMSASFIWHLPTNELFSAQSTVLIAICWESTQLTLLNCSVSVRCLSKVGISNEEAESCCPRCRGLCHCRKCETSNLKVNQKTARRGSAKLQALSPNQEHPRDGGKRGDLKKVDLFMPFSTYFTYVHWELVFKIKMHLRHNTNTLSYPEDGSLFLRIYQNDEICLLCCCDSCLTPRHPSNVGLKSMLVLERVSSWCNHP